MLNKKQITDVWDKLVHNQILNSYNPVYKSGYKQALEDVLEMKRPKAQPANVPKGFELKECNKCEHYYKSGCNSCGMDWDHNVRLIRSSRFNENKNKGAD